MKLWILKRIDRPDWDEMAGMVVRALDETAARGLAATEAGNEGFVVWLAAATASCEELTTDGEPEVIIMDFNAG